MKKEVIRPSHSEYVKFVESEFSFLETLYGFNKVWNKTNRFQVRYSLNSISVSIWGWGYGESGHASISFKDEELPYFEYVTSFDRKLTEPTGKQQLDDLKEHAHRIRNECQTVLQGDLSVLDELRPFPKAEEFWAKRDYKTIVESLEKNKKPLSIKWQNRYEYAIKNA